VSADPAALLPHGDGALLVSAVVSSTPEVTRCTGRLDGDHALSHEGRGPALCALEMAAQAAGLHQADGEGAGAVRTGYLVGVRSATFHADDLPADTDLEVEVRPESSAPPLRQWRASVAGPEGRLLDVRFSTWMASDD
jgi:predicted hotdog family 3-hydroxylacyl-ACP dehydratase